MDNAIKAKATNRLGVNVCMIYRRKSQRGSSNGRCHATLILRPTRINVLIPKQNPARHALDVLEALLAEHLSELQASRAAAAIHDHFFIGVCLERSKMLGDLRQG